MNTIILATILIILGIIFIMLFVFGVVMVETKKDQLRKLTLDLENLKAQMEELKKPKK